jgi:hypothetical protein
MVLDIGEAHALPVQGIRDRNPRHAGRTDGCQVVRVPEATAGRHRHIHRVADLLHQRDVEALARAFLVDRCQQDLAGTELGGAG